MIIKKNPEDFIVEEVPGDFKEGRYCIYMLKKSSMNTEKAIELLCQKFKINRNRVKYSGTKDRNAITIQYISIDDKRRFELKEPDMELTYIGTSAEPLSLGSLKGNKFTIIVREITSNEMTNLESRKHLRHMPNYFDEQRFSKNNLDIGLSILKKDFAKAAEILTQSNYERFHEQIQENPNDYIGAIRKMQQKILTMFIHSVQSYIYNETLYRMLKEKSGYDIEYSLGKLRFPTENIENVQIPLVGFDYDGTNETINSIMKELGITSKDFITRAIPELTTDTSQRDIITEISDFSHETIDEKTIKLNFYLPKGSYATIAIKMLFG